MSNCEPILSEFLTKEELAAELRRNPRTAAANARRTPGALSASERGEVDCCARAKIGRSMNTPDAASSGTDPEKK
jgi:hypothetical protein